MSWAFCFGVFVNVCVLFCFIRSDEMKTIQYKLNFIYYLIFHFKLKLETWIKLYQCLRRCFFLSIDRSIVPNQLCLIRLLIFKKKIERISTETKVRYFSTKRHRLHLIFFFLNKLPVKASTLLTQSQYCQNREQIDKLSFQERIKKRNNTGKQFQPSFEWFTFIKVFPVVKFVFTTVLICFDPKH